MQRAALPELHLSSTTPKKNFIVLTMSHPSISHRSAIEALLQALASESQKTASLHTVHVSAVQSYELENNSNRPSPLETRAAPPGHERTPIPIASYTAALRRLLLTLHCLLPTLMLPALDLLDRGRVVRIVVVRSKDAAGSAGLNSSRPQGLHGVEDEASDTGLARREKKLRASSAHDLFLIRSRTSLSKQLCQVRLDAWSCSCVEFSFGLFTSTL
jgi:hypothetical protein